MQEKEEKKMPNIKLPYNAEGIELADKIADKVEDVGGEMSQDMPTSNASMRNTTMDLNDYETGGDINIDSMGYQKGGKVPSARPRSDYVRIEDNNKTDFIKGSITLPKAKTNLRGTAADKIISPTALGVKESIKEAKKAIIKGEKVTPLVKSLKKAITKGLKKIKKIKLKKKKGGVYKNTDVGIRKR
tara:strand:+ start:498 stop:1058 length:561 start_codon:yes stop_codon:yes gene_type:complete